jgi:hypothetical protein
LPEYIRTDTASIGADGEKLDRVVPEKVIINVDGVDVKVLDKLADWKYGQIEIEPQYDPQLPGNQKALMNHTDESLRKISTPAARNSEAVFKYTINPVLTKYVATTATPTASDYDGAVNLTVQFWSP